MIANFNAGQMPQARRHCEIWTRLLTAEKDFGGG